MSSEANGSTNVELPEWIEDLQQKARAATPQDLTTACEVSNGYYECPSCNGNGELFCGTDYTNYDHVAQTVHFYGIGDEHVKSEAYFRAASTANVLLLIAKLREALAAKAEADRLHALTVAELGRVKDVAMGAVRDYLRDAWLYSDDDERELQDVDAEAQAEFDRRYALTDAGVYSQEEA